MVAKKMYNLDKPEKIRNRRDCLVSIVAPAYNEEDNLPRLFKAISKIMDEQGCQFELVIAENGSHDKSLDVLRGLHAIDDRLRYVSLTRNFGSQGGLVAGLEHCRGEVIIMMDADLQHPPEKIPDFLSEWEKGYDIVTSQRNNSDFTSIKRAIINKIYYRLMYKLTGLPLEDGQSDFRLMDRKALNALLHLPEKSKFLRGLVFWIGFRQSSISYDVQARYSGNTKYRLIDLIRFTIHGAISFSAIPLQLFSVFGFLISFGALIYGASIVANWAFGFTDMLPPGGAAMSTGIFFLGGVQLIGIGVLGEYIAKIYDETRGRPTYIVQEMSSPASVGTVSH